CQPDKPPTVLPRRHARSQAGARLARSPSVPCAFVRPGSPSIAFAACAFLLSSSALLRAGVVLDGTLGPRRTLTGPSYSITPDLGKQIGGNLFQSFSSFGLTQGETALF